MPFAPKMTSPLYPIFRKRIDDFVARIIQDQVTPWAFLSSGHPMRVKTFSGKQISYQNLEFEGSPRQVFWSRYIEPFLEDMCVTEIDAAVSLAKEREVTNNEFLLEVKNVLRGGCKRVYDRMAEIDRNLRGRGDPKSVGTYAIDRKFNAMAAFIEERIAAELALWKPKPGFEIWCSRHKALTALLVAAVGGAAATLIKFLIGF